MKNEKTKFVFRKSIQPKHPWRKLAELKNLFHCYSDAETVIFISLHIYLDIGQTRPRTDQTDVLIDMMTRVSHGDLHLSLREIVLKHQDDSRSKCLITHSCSAFFIM